MKRNSTGDEMKATTFPELLAEASQCVFRPS